VGDGLGGDKDFFQQAMDVALAGKCCADFVELLEPAKQAVVRIVHFI